MKHSAFPAYAIASLLLFASQFATCAQDYKVQFDFPSQVGDKFRFRFIGGETNHFNVTQNGAALQKRASRQTWELDAEVTVTGVSGRNMANKLVIVVNKFIATSQGRPMPVPLKDTTILASVKDGEEQFTIAGKLAENDLHKTLKRAFDLDDGGATNDESFGTKERQRVGDTWKANAEVMAKDVRREGLTINPADISASTQLTKMEPVDGKDCLHVVVTSDIKNIKPPKREDLRFKEAGMKLRIAVAIPVDLKTPELALNQIMNMRMVMQSTRQPDVEIETTSVATANVRYTHHPRD